MVEILCGGEKRCLLTPKMPDVRCTGNNLAGRIAISVSGTLTFVCPSSENQIGILPIKCQYLDTLNPTLTQQGLIKLTLEFPDDLLKHRFNKLKSSLENQRCPERAV